MPSFFALAQRAVALWQGDTNTGFLQDYSAVCLRYTAKYLADAYTRYFQAREAAAARGKTRPIRKSDGKPITFPRRKSKRRTVDGFTIPQDVRLDGTHLHIPKIGWVRLSGGHRYLGCQARQVRVVKAGTDARPKWYTPMCATPCLRTA